MNLNRPDIDVRLEAATAQAAAEISRTDTKAATLLTAYSLPLAVLVTVIPGSDLPGPAAVLVGLGAVGLVAAMILVLLVVRPRITGTPPGTYLRWAECTTAEEVLEDLQADRRAEDITRLSQIAKKKHRGIRIAIDATAAALIVLVLALLVALL